MNCDYCIEQSHGSYGYQQQIITLIIVPDISKLTIHQLNYLYLRSSFSKYEQQSHFVSPHPSFVPFGS